MAEITLKGTPCQTSGELPIIGSLAPAFTLTKTDLADVTLDSLKDKNVILNIFVSIDTPTCATSVRKFNELASQLANTVVLCVSADLPFAHKRFCAAENLNNVIPVSTFRSPQFANEYGVGITSGPLTGLLARALVVIDKNGKILHTELVQEIADEPNYDTALQTLT